MSCHSCSSVNEADLTAEIMIHFSGRRHLQNGGVLVFPRIYVCLDCGATRFTVPEKELTLVRKELGSPNAPVKLEGEVS